MTTTENRTEQHPHRVLTIAGSDPTGGAGLQADLKTISALGGHAMTAITAITVQNRHGVKEMLPLDPDLLFRQALFCLSDIGADAIKLGMLATQETVLAVTELLRQYPDIPVVADPVLSGTFGGRLLTPQGLSAYQHHLLPHLDIITPNLHEAEALTGLPVRSVADMEKAAQHLANRSRGAALITGGHLPGNTLTEVLHEYHNTSNLHFSSQKIAGGERHGTGCTLASAIASGLAQGCSIRTAVQQALAFTQQAIRKSWRPDHGQQLLRIP